MSDPRLKIGDMKTYYWHDYETFGLDPARARVAQFAGVRTDLDLNIIGEPLIQYCKLSEDALPNPGACLVTGITPQTVEEKGVCEAEFAANIYEEFSQPGTCTIGYNSIEFDDEFTRYLLYRNLYNPYFHHGKVLGNSRWDLINVVRFIRALNPKGINWPLKEDGSSTMRLERLTVANGIHHGDAHDAYGDVRATIELARLLKEHHSDLFDFGYNNRDKNSVRKLFGYANNGKLVPKPVVHISSIYGSKNNYIGVVYPVVQHPAKSNSYIVINLREDSTPLQNNSVRDLRQCMFTKSADRTEDMPRIPLYEINFSRCPVLVPMDMLDGADRKRLHLNGNVCKENLRKVKEIVDLRHVAAQVYSGSFKDPTDPDLMLYGGDFIEKHDRKILDKIRETEPEKIKSHYSFGDLRLNEMVFRYRARNYSHVLSQEEQEKWKSFRSRRLRNLDGGNTYSLTDYFKDINQRLDAESITPDQKGILYDLEKYGKTLLEEFLTEITP